MKPIEAKVLGFVGKEYADARAVSEACGEPFATVASVLESLRDAGFVELRKETAEALQLTAEGKEYASKGLPEERLFRALPASASVPLQEAFKKARLTPAEQSIALQWAKKKEWVEVKTGKISRKKKATAKKAFDATRLGSLDEATKKELLKRGLVDATKTKRILVKATGRQPSEARATSLTPQDLKTGAWRKKKFAEYDLETVAAPLLVGKKHAYAELLNDVKRRLVGLGFTEVHGPLVELEFWNMDALFMAQDHPAREIHDVFQVDDPSRGEILDKELLKRVQKSHEKGSRGSRGWGYKWDPEIAARLVMRSQTTPVSARCLASGVECPARVFCIGRVFRPDEIDWQHFIEFNQCEGIVVDEGLSFRELLGYLKDFALEVFGAEDARFAPSYFPFTEPSVELQARIPGKGWVEVGGAGMFRPEMLEPLGVKVPVLAWGLGIDRLAMIKLHAKDIRDLFSRDVEYLRKI